MHTFIYSFLFAHGLSSDHFNYEQQNNYKTIMLRSASGDNVDLIVWYIPHTETVIINDTIM